MAHRCNHPDCNKVFSQPRIEKVFCFRRGGKQTFTCESCATKELRSIGIVTRPKSVHHIHSLIQKEINELKKLLQTDTADPEMRLVRIGVVTQRIYGTNNPFFGKK